jgi:putative aminopeptidase FrvX
MAIPKTLEALLTAPGSPSGREAPAAEAFRTAARPIADEVVADVNGSTVATLRGTGGGRSVAVIGHIDEIGLIVTHIDEKGFLWISGVGGWDPVQLVGQRVVITTAGGFVHGIVGKKPIHLIEPDERSKAPKLTQLHVDIGAKDGDDAKSMVEVGDVMVIDAQPLELPNDRLASKALDNRLGCYIAWRALELVKEAGGAAGDFHACAVVQEETGLAGARMTAFSLQPDVAIVVDVTHATDAPGVSETENGSHGLGSGAVIFRATALHPAVADGLRAAAAERDVSYTLEATGRGTGTDADTVAIAQGGIPVGVVSIPLRYMHSSVELCQLDDVEACAQLCAAYALSLAADAVFER